ncbi:hypothetical protein B296_00029975 [Ensete ventricosum]|uniref:Uncharacterized protein n=1 Tax=Ensete ventricosum TaxID=4639 RepID=A0A427A9V8_ENSVE|nr:hypothetical protein B296_00029975 [Ensete ventricosum]
MGMATYHARVMHHSMGKDLMHNIIGCCAVSIRSWDLERSYNDKARIARDLPVRGTDNHRRTIPPTRTASGFFGRFCGRLKNSNANSTVVVVPQRAPPVMVGQNGRHSWWIPHLMALIPCGNFAGLYAVG